MPPRRPKTHPAIRELMMFDSPYPPIPHRQSSTTSLPLRIHEDQQPSQAGYVSPTFLRSFSNMQLIRQKSRSHDKGFAPRRATTGVVPPHVLASRRNVSGPAAYGGGNAGERRNLVLSSAYIDITAATKVNNKDIDNDSSDDDPIPAEILDNASVPMFVSSRTSSLTTSGLPSGDQSMPKFQSSAVRKSLDPRNSPSSTLETHVGPARGPPSPPARFSENPSFENHTTRSSAFRFPSAGSLSDRQPSTRTSGRTSTRTSTGTSISASTRVATETSTSASTSNSIRPPPTESPDHGSPSSVHSIPASPLPEYPSSPTQPPTPIPNPSPPHEEPQEPPQDVQRHPVLFLIDGIKEVGRRIHNNVPESEDTFTPSKEENYMQMLDGMFDEIKNLNICSPTEKESDTSLPLISKLIHQRLSILKDIPSSLIPDKSKVMKKGKETSPIMATFTRARKGSISSAMSSQKEKTSGRPFWKRNSGSSASAPPPDTTRFSLDDDAEIAKKRDSLIVELIWALKGICPATKNVAQYGEWERMAGEDGRISAYSLLKPEDKWMLNQLRAHMDKQ